MIKRKTTRKLIIFGVIFIILLSLVVCVFLPQKPSNYTLEEHIERISKLVEKRYIGEKEKSSRYPKWYEETEFTSYEIFPLYNDKDELTHFLIEFEPKGFVYVKMITTMGILGKGMYVCDNYEGESWRHYVVEKGIEPTPTKPNKNGIIISHPDRRWEVDENGGYIDYYDSHFKVANIKNERRYLLTIRQDGRDGFIPTVKRGDKYLNLVSMEEMEYTEELTIRKYATADMAFIPKPSYFGL